MSDEELLKLIHEFDKLKASEEVYRASLSSIMRCQEVLCEELAELLDPDEKVYIAVGATLYSVSRHNTPLAFVSKLGEVVLGVSPDE